MSILKEIADSLKPKDPVQEAINSIDMPDPTFLEDDQIEHLVDYMRDMIAGAMKRGNVMSSKEAAHMALEDVAGFESVEPRKKAAVVNKLVQAYTKQFGN